MVSRSVIGLALGNFDKLIRKTSKRGATNTKFDLRNLVCREGVRFAGKNPRDTAKNWLEYRVAFFYVFHFDLHVYLHQCLVPPGRGCGSHSKALALSKGYGVGSGAVFGGAKSLSEVEDVVAPFFVEFPAQIRHAKIGAIVF